MPLDFFVTLGCLVGTGVLGIMEQVKCSPTKYDSEVGRRSRIAEKIKNLSFDEKYNLYISAYHDDPPAMAYCTMYDQRVVNCMEYKIFDKMGLTWSEAYLLNDFCNLCPSNKRWCTSLYNCLKIKGYPYTSNYMEYYNKTNSYRPKDFYGDALSYKLGTKHPCNIRQWRKYYGDPFVDQILKLYGNDG